MTSISDSETARTTEQATVGGGCFWCLDAAFRMVPGVREVVSGYAGGKEGLTSYREVCTGATGHAEVVQVTFDRREITYGEILDVFWAIHDPTTLNRQGADHGTQYRSIILFHSDEQRGVAEQSRAGVQELLGKPVVTEIVPLTEFYPAEEYHQDYYARNGGAPYCSLVIEPKLRKLRLKLLD